MSNENEKNIGDTSSLTVSEIASKKIAAELKSFNGGTREKVVSSFVASTLTHFCEGSERFAKAVIATTRTLSDTCAEVMAEHPGNVSDIDVYRGAVKAYFPNAEVIFRMEISITGDDPTEDDLTREPKKKVPAPKPQKEKNESEKPKAKPPAKPPIKPPVKPAKEVKPAKPHTAAKPPKAPKIETIQLTLDF
jgi:hypothetical protein